MTTSVQERRHASAWEIEAIELRADGTGRRIEGHAAVFNRLSREIYGFREKIDPGAFATAIRNDDVKALWNHDPGLVLGRNKSGTLELAEDKRGLAFALELPESPVGENALQAIRRGDVSEMSFGFSAVREEWEQEGEGKIPTRRLVEVHLFDVSPVAFPAYTGTDVSARSEYASALESLEDHMAAWSRDPDAWEKHLLREAEILGWTEE